MEFTFDKVLEEYVDVLDDFQREVDNIRIMHHDIWKESRVYPIIKQHRAGSRVEKQCRILPMGKQTDVDYKFEVTGVVVEMDKQSGLYWKVSSSSNAHGKLFVTEATKNELTKNKQYSEIFRETTFDWAPEEGAYVLLPGPFKERVVQVSQFEYQKDARPPVNSPSLPGQGAVNEYDIVPCLRLSRWPPSVFKWVDDKDSEFKPLNKQFRTIMLANEALFVVPAGNPVSEEKELEFRLSFSLLEVKCFEQLSSYNRKLFGLIKYLFKIKLEFVDLLDSYHIKSLFFRMIDNGTLMSQNYLKDLFRFFEIVKTACQNETINHIFIENCNIFPFHKTNRRHKISKTIDILKISSDIISELQVLIRRDLNIQECSDESWLGKAMGEVSLRKTKFNKKVTYINGYLTRLLSLITYSLYENQKQNTLASAISAVERTFQEYSNDRNIFRMIQMVNATIERLDKCNEAPHLISNPSIDCSSTDKISQEVHFAFEAYLYQDFGRVVAHLENIPFNSEVCDASFIGISITSYHKNFELDEPFHHAIADLERRSRERKCPRFYMDPIFLAHHLMLQVRLKTGGQNIDQKDIDTLENFSLSLSIREPYLGRLSYKYSAILLLQGYKRLLEQYNLTFKYISSEDIDSFKHRLYATNFDLR